MAYGKGKVGKKLIQWIPMLAVFYAFYDYYSDRGFEGIMADIDAVTVQGIQAKALNIAAGFSAFILGDIIAQYITKNAYVRVLIRTFAYYFGARWLAMALRQGAGYGGSRSTGKGISRFAANPYMGG